MKCLDEAIAIAAMPKNQKPAIRRRSSVFLLPVFLFLTSVLMSCEKFLDEKPDQKLVVPESLDDLQALLDYYAIHLIESDAGEISSDDYSITDVNYAALASDFHRRLYRWEAYGVFEEGTSFEAWGRYYTTVYYCNTVLEGLDKIARVSSDAEKYDGIKGRSLFVRAQKLFQASVLWCAAYSEESAENQLGMPLRLDTDFNKVSVRASLKETFQQILKDATGAVQLLPIAVSHSVEPSRCAAYALLSRVHLYMGNYDSAYHYADSALALNGELMDYSTLNGSATYPITQYNKEIIYTLSMGSPQILNITRAQVVNELIESYDDKDLRKSLYFSSNANGTKGFRGRYSGGASLFAGFATDEQYLIRAESALRTGKIDRAVTDLDDLLRTRWSKNNGISTFEGIQEREADKLLSRIVAERRKSLLFRGLRWYDLKRLNRDGANITLKRVVEGNELLLLPNDPRYALAVPNDIVVMSDIVQNPR